MKKSDIFFLICFCVAVKGKQSPHPLPPEAVISFDPIGLYIPTTSTLVLNLPVNACQFDSVIQETRKIIEEAPETPDNFRSELERFVNFINNEVNR